MAKNQEGMLAEEAEDTDADSRMYELGFHLDPELPTEEVKKAYQTMRGLIASKGAIIAESDPEKIQLAYTISRQDTASRRDFNSAYFSWIAYEISAENHAEIISAASADTRVIRFIDLLTTKDAARHALEMRALSLKAPERAKESEAVSSVELDAVLERVEV